MKKTLILLIVIVSSINLKAQTSIKFYNNTGKDISASYAYYDASNACWSSVGWYLIKPYKELEINLGNYKGKVYIHGWQIGLLGDKFWGSGYSFCVDTKNAFNIRNADKIECNKKRSFSEAVIKPGINKWTFNP